MDSDVILMKKIAEGDLWAFRRLVERHQKALLNFIYRYTGDRLLAEDITQEVFLRVHKSAPYYKPKAKFSTWLFKIATNLCLNELRKKNPHVVSLTAPDDSRRSPLTPGHLLEKSKPDSILETRELNMAILDAIGALPEKQRVAFLLHRYEDKTYGQISEIMGCTVASVESLLFRAKQNLRKRLNDIWRTE
jgi:RNA polymerase sigma-70 factor (ECF subfamily)